MGELEHDTGNENGIHGGTASGSAGHAFATLLEHARALDSGALGALYTRYLPVVYRTILARVGDVHLAEDLAADTFMVMVDSIARVRSQDELGFAAWLLGIARNKTAEHYRRLSTRPAMRGELQPQDEPQALGEEGDPLGVVIARERWAEVVAAAGRLTSEQRAVLHYRCVLGYSTFEVARKMSREPGAIRALQFRALSALARILATNGTNPAVAALRTITSPSRPESASGQVFRPKATAKEQPR